MKTTIIGFPRVGSLRELKFASEKYFRKEITAQELQDTAKTLRNTHWNVRWRFLNWTHTLQWLVDTRAQKVT